MSLNWAHDPLALVDYQAGAGALLLCDGAPSAERLGLAVSIAGLRAVAVHDTGSGSGALNARGAVPLVVCEFAHDHGRPLDDLLARIRKEAQSGQYRCVVSAPPHLTDMVDAAVGGVVGVTHLCDPTLVQFTNALAEAAHPAEPRLHDAGRSAERLQQLSEEAGRIASALAELCEDEAIVPGKPGKANGPSDLDAGKVRAIIRARRLRDQFFQSELFADPAWDMLLDLMAARLEGQRVAVSSLCIAAAVPATTALRWIKTLTDLGLFVRVADPQDGRRVYIELSDKAAAALENYLRAVHRLSPLAI